VSSDSAVWQRRMMESHPETCWCFVAPDKVCILNRPCPTHEPNPWRQEALVAIAAVQKYEDEHPAALLDGTPCFQQAMELMQKLLADADTRADYDPTTTVAGSTTGQSRAGNSPSEQVRDA
jgi:hypothetical protein